MFDWPQLVIFVIVAGALLAAGRKLPRDAQYEVVEEEPCDTCLRWDECNGVDNTCPLRRNRNGR